MPRRGGAVAAAEPSSEPGLPRSFGGGEISYEQITPLAPRVYMHIRSSSTTMLTIGPASLAAAASTAEPNIPDAEFTRIAPGAPPTSRATAPRRGG